VTWGDFDLEVTWGDFDLEVTWGDFDLEVTWGDFDLKMTWGDFDLEVTWRWWAGWFAGSCSSRASSEPRVPAAAISRPG